MKRPDPIQSAVREAIAKFGASDDARPAVIKEAKKNALRRKLWDRGENALWERLDREWVALNKATDPN